MGKCIKKIVVSAVNFTDGGPLSILRECLEYISSDLAGPYEIIALVNDKRLFNHKNIDFYSFPLSKKSWVARLWYEYSYFNKLAKDLNPFLWFSLHDITPNVTVNRLAVYCHNPAPFYKWALKDARLDPKFALFNLFYKYLYWINIKKNDFVIVQQEWMRQAFIKLFKIKNVIVSHPEICDAYPVGEKQAGAEMGNRIVFFYPAFPRVFKNFEVVCKASDILLKQGIYSFQVMLTISGKENRYSRSIYNSTKHVKNIKFIGIQTKESIFNLYKCANCLIFPSKLETWGLPISEFKKYNKPILLADLPYAHETLGTFDKAKFFNPDDPEQLARAMKDVINRKAVFEKTEADNIQAPFSHNWKELFDILLTPD